MVSQFSGVTLVELSQCLNVQCVEKIKKCTSVGEAIYHRPLAKLIGLLFQLLQPLSLLLLVPEMRSPPTY